MRQLLFGAGLLLLVGMGTLTAQDLPVFLDDKQDLETRIEDALQRLTIEEKVALLQAQSKFSSAGVPRLGIPEVWMTDGPHGMRPEVRLDEWEPAGRANEAASDCPAVPDPAGR